MNKKEIIKYIEKLNSNDHFNIKITELDNDHITYEITQIKQNYKINEIISILNGE